MDEYKEFVTAIIKAEKKKELETEFSDMSKQLYTLYKKWLMRGFRKIKRSK